VLVVPEVEVVAKLELVVEEEEQVEFAVVVVVDAGLGQVVVEGVPV
jgi:hypothetical protein